MAGFLLKLSLLFYTLQLIKAAKIDDAETALNVLRKAMSDNLNGAFLEHTKLATQVDNVAMDTKLDALAQINLKIESLHLLLAKIKAAPSNQIQNCRKVLAKSYALANTEVINCVNAQAADAIDLIYNKSSTLTNMILRVIYNEEKDIIFCGRNADDCLVDVIASINHKEESLPDVVNNEVEVDRQAVEKQIKLIKACGDKVVKEVQLAANKCVF